MLPLGRLLPALLLLLAVLYVGCASAGARLIAAIEARDQAAVIEALRAGQIDVNALVELGANSATRPLRAAAQAGDLPIARALLDAGADPNRAEAWEETPLMIAATNKDLPMVQLLLERGADPRRTIGSGDTALRKLFVDLDCGRARDVLPAITAALLAAGADPNANTGWGPPPLHAAIKCRSPESVKLLLAHGADKELTDDRGRTPLMEAAEVSREASLEMIALLLEAGADGAKVCDAISGSLRSDPRDDARMRYLAARGDPCARTRLEMADTRAEAAAEAAAKRGPSIDFNSSASPEPPPEPPPKVSAPVRRDDPPPLARCTSGGRACGKHCCSTGEWCCVPDGARNQQGGMCMTLPTGRGCPWGMHFE